MKRFIQLPASFPLTVRLPERSGHAASVHLVAKDDIQAVNAALACGRPLLVRGEPGTGKSQLARAAAELLGRAFVPFTVDARTDVHDVLYSVDVVARLAEAQIAGAPAPAGQATKSSQDRLDLRNFVAPGPLWWALNLRSAIQQAKNANIGWRPGAPEGWEADEGAVILIDEIDKADSAVPNAMLDALGHGRFEVRGVGEVVREGAAPLVIITTNEERALPDAFVRRCLVLRQVLPTDREPLIAELVQVGRAHFERVHESVLKAAAGMVADDRAESLRLGLAPPGRAEFVDLVAAATEQTPETAAQMALLDAVRPFALDKHGREREI